MPKIDKTYPYIKLNIAAIFTKGNVSYESKSLVLNFFPCSNTENDVVDISIDAEEDCYWQIQRSQFQYIDKEYRLAENKNWYLIPPSFTDFGIFVGIYWIHLTEADDYDIFYQISSELKYPQSLRIKHEDTPLLLKTIKEAFRNKSFWRLEP